MFAHDAKLLALLPAVGLCACALPREQAHEPAHPSERGSPVPSFGRLLDSGRAPLTSYEALVRSGRESLLAGHYEAALESLTMALEWDPERIALHVDQLDALIGLGDLSRAEDLLDSLAWRLTGTEDGAEDEDGQAAREAAIWRPRLDRRRLSMLELRNGRGFGPCEVTIDERAQALGRTNDPFAAWNVLRSGLPADHAIPIPTSEAEARAALCPADCPIGVPGLARLEGDNEATIALVIAHSDGSLSVLPDLLHPVAASCEDQTAFAYERHDGLLRVRAFGDRLEQVDPTNWKLVELPDYGAPPPSVVTGPPVSAYSSSSGYHSRYSYNSSGYNSSGYNSSGYNSSGYGYSYSCGGGYDYYDQDDYDQDGYDNCEVHAHVERDIVIDLARGEVVLDIVRSGPRGSALGRVTMASAGPPALTVEACGVSRSVL